MASDIPSSGSPSFAFTYPPTCSDFTATQERYLRSNFSTGCDFIATGALVFDRSEPAGPRILLLQRSAADSMPNRWEVPGGGCDDEDESIMHSAARELWEEAGLKARRIGPPVGVPHLFTSRSGKQICRFNFLVEAETNSESRLAVTLDPKEHQRFIWANESEVKARQVDDLKMEFTTEEALAIILDAFKRAKQSSQDEDRIQNPD